MLKEHKNKWAQTVSSAIESSNVEVNETDAFHFSIKLRNSPLIFMLRQDPDNFDHFFWAFSLYRPGYPLSVPLGLFEGKLPDRNQPHVYSAMDDAHGNSDAVCVILADWLDDVASRYLNEQEIPDLWLQLQQFSFYQGESSIPQDDLRRFADPEKQQIKQGIEEFKKLIQANFDPVQEQLKTINERLDYLSRAVDRLNRFDWKAQAVSTLASIAVNLSVDTAMGHQLLMLFRQALGFVAGHLPSVA